MRACFDGLEMNLSCPFFRAISKGEELFIHPLFIEPSRHKRMQSAHERSRISCSDCSAVGSEQLKICGRSQAREDHHVQLKFRKFSESQSSSRNYSSAISLSRKLQHIDIFARNLCNAIFRCKRNGTERQTGLAL